MCSTANRLNRAQESSWNSEREAAEAQAHYEESIRQLHLIVSIVSRLKSYLFLDHSMS